MSKLNNVLSSAVIGDCIINFMYEPINRFVNNAAQANNFQQLFGCPVPPSIAQSSPKSRKLQLLDLYKTQLSRIGGMRYVNEIAVTKKNPQVVYYYLVHGTRHPKGVEVFKNASWKLDPVTGTRFSAGGQLPLGNVMTQPLASQLISRYSGRTCDVKTMERFVLLETDYLPTHLRGVLRELEDSQQMMHVGGARQRRNTYPHDTIWRYV